MKRRVVVVFITLLLLISSNVIAYSFKKTSGIEYPQGKSVTRVDIINGSGITLKFGWSEPPGGANCLALPGSQTSTGFPFTSVNSTKICGSTITNSTANILNIIIWFSLLTGIIWIFYVFLFNKRLRSKPAK